MNTEFQFLLNLYSFKPGITNKICKNEFTEEYIAFVKKIKDYHAERIHELYRKTYDNGIEKPLKHPVITIRYYETPEGKYGIDALQEYFYSQNISWNDCIAIQYRKTQVLERPQVCYCCHEDQKQNEDVELSGLDISFLFGGIIGIVSALML